MRRLPLHPFLFALYPVVAMLAHNADEVRLSEGLRSLVIALGVAAVLLAVIRVILRDSLRAALVCTLGLVLFFSYGHIYQALGGMGAVGEALGRHRFMIPLWLVLLLGGSLLIARSRSHHVALSTGLNVAALALLILPVGQIWAAESRARGALAAGEEAAGAECGLRPRDGQVLPDIYYILLDGYARQDVLSESFNFDNQPFLDELSERGFYIAEWSQSNYFTTQLSLASTFNLEYLDLPARQELARTAEREQISAMRTQGAVRRNLECLGYTIVAFESSSPSSTWRDADVFLSPEPRGEQNLALSGMNAFEAMLFNSTAGLVLSDAAILVPQAMRPDTDLPMREHRERVRFAFDTIGEGVPRLASPKFVFAHIVAPHTPYAFGPNGEDVDPGGTFTLQSGAEDESQVIGYRNNVMFVNAETLQAIDGILEHSARPPVIILQSDHGTKGSAHDRLANLSAFYFPDGGDADLYPTITPVNTFRVVFNRYLGGQFELLPDVSYYSAEGSYSNLTVVPNPHAAEAVAP